MRRIPGSESAAYRSLSIALAHAAFAGGPAARDVLLRRAAARLAGIALLVALLVLLALLSALAVLVLLALLSALAVLVLLALPLLALPLSLVTRSITVRHVALHW
jgi:hypothetical protein